MNPPSYSNAVQSLSSSPNYPPAEITKKFNSKLKIMDDLKLLKNDYEALKIKKNHLTMKLIA